MKQQRAAIKDLNKPSKESGLKKQNVFNSSIEEAEAGGSLRVQSKSGLHCEFQASLALHTQSCLKKVKKLRQP